MRAAAMHAAAMTAPKRKGRVGRKAQSDHALGRGAHAEGKDEQAKEKLFHPVLPQFPAGADFGQAMRSVSVPGKKVNLSSAISGAKSQLAR